MATRDTDGNGEVEITVENTSPSGGQVARGALTWLNRVGEQYGGIATLLSAASAAIAVTYFAARGGR